MTKKVGGPGTSFLHACGKVTFTQWLVTEYTVVSKFCIARIVKSDMTDGRS